MRCVSRLNTDDRCPARLRRDAVRRGVRPLVCLVLTVAVIVAISWQVTLLSLLLLHLPGPARAMGGRLASLQRQSAQYKRADVHAYDRASRGRRHPGQA
ncbi:hypothetical protein QJS66_14700 [Kocuria rhizophila]|nr:hypothetical protein QJS66_14700 [Kocuria rhizophila]